MIVQKLKPWVTSFSEAITHQYKHGDELWVGGQVTDIFTIPNVQDLVPAEELAKEPLLDAVYLTVDDGVGINRLVVPREAFLKYKELFDLKVGMIVLAQGKVYQMEMKETSKKGETRTIANHPEGSTRIYCWKVVPLPDKVEEQE